MATITLNSFVTPFRYRTNISRSYSTFVKLINNRYIPIDKAVKFYWG